jgi:poly(3-hydroxybutyrate) depolymerase
MNADILSRLARIAAIVLASLAASTACAGTPVPGGKWSFVWTDKKGMDVPMRVYTYRPRTCDSTCPMVIVLHGKSRNASDYRDYWELAADRYKVLVVAPEFSEQYWPKSAGYNQGGVGQQQDKEKWVFATIEHLFDEMRDGQQSYVLFGHSAGGQVAHRMLLLRPDNRASIIAAANPGWYTMPEFRKDKAVGSFPFSLAGSPSGEAEVRKALARRFILLLGEEDDDPDAENMSKSDGAMKQGATRLERGETFFMTATTVANDLGVKLAWELNEVPGVGHKGSTMSKVAADTLFKK